MNTTANRIDLRWERHLAVTLLICLLAPSAAARISLETQVAKVAVSSDGIETRLVSAGTVVPGDELRYTISFTNTSTQTTLPESIVITNPLPEGAVYVAGSAGGEDVVIEYSVDGENFAPGEQRVPAGSAQSADAATGSYRAIRWRYQRALLPDESSSVYFHVLLNAVPGQRPGPPL